MIPDTDRPTVYDWNATCDICLRLRSAGGHQKCSKKRQALRRQEQEPRQQCAWLSARC